MRRGFALVLMATATAGAASASGGGIWKALHRPLHIPHLAKGSACPVSVQAAQSGVRPRFAGGRPLIRFTYPPPRSNRFYGSPWSGEKMLWVIPKAHRGPLLVRGRQLDGPNRVRFEGGQIPATERRIRAAGSSLRASFARLRAPGCYGLQVDGIGFSRVFVFQASLKGPVTEDEVLSRLRSRGLPMQRADAYHSIAFDELLHVVGREYENPEGPVVLWEFPSFAKAQSVLIDRGGAGVTLHTANGLYGAAIFCAAAPCSPLTEPPARHWFRSGRVIAVYLGDDPVSFSAIEHVLGGQFAGTAEPQRVCLASPVEGNYVHAGVIRGAIDPFTDVVDGRFRLHVGEYRDVANGIFQKILWSIPMSRHPGGKLVVRGRTLFRPHRTFVQTFQYAWADDQTQRFYPSTIIPPSAGCWRLALTAGRLRNALTVRVDG